MRFPFSLLKIFLNLEIDPETVAFHLTNLGLEVDKIENLFPSFQGVVGATIKEVKKHPEADKLKIAEVFDGTKNLQVVCGAPNCRPGIKVALAKEGATLDNGKFKIGKAKLRGVESHGMLCTLKELTLGDEADKILELDQDYVIGSDIAKNLCDPIFEVSLTPNLGRCLSVIGIARELAAAIGKKTGFEPKKITPAFSSKIKIENKTGENLLSYSGRLIKNINISPSPLWLRLVLSSSGMRSINTPVDVTNYIMLLLGQPLHSFDYDKMVGDAIIIDKTSSQTTFEALDEKSYTPVQDTLLICDREKPLAIAGIIGGNYSATTENTKNIFLESAIFLPNSIQRSSKMMGIKTQSSLRFEKGIDPEMSSVALDEACYLIQKLCGGAISEITGIAPQPISRRHLKCDIKRANKLLGTSLGVGEAEEIFKKLEMETKSDEEGIITVSVPSYRNDLNIEEDLIEELARIFGYNNIPRKISLCHNSPISHSPMYKFENKIKEKLVATGLQEFITPDLISPYLASLCEKMDIAKNSIIATLSSKTQDHSILRPTMLPSFLQLVKYNNAHKEMEVNGFEICRLHHKEGDTFHEKSALAVIISGSLSAPFWGEESSDANFFKLKGILESLFLSLNIDEGFSLKPKKRTAFHPLRQGEIFIFDKKIGFMGEVHPDLEKDFDLKKKNYFAEIDLNLLYELTPKEQMVKTFSEYPESIRDLTLTLPEKMPMGKIFSYLGEIASGILENFRLLYIYTGDKVESGKKNVTLRFLYRSKERTVSFEEVEREHNKIVEKLKEKIKEA